MQNMEGKPESMLQTKEEKPLRLKFKRIDGKWQIEKEAQSPNGEAAALMCVTGYSTNNDNVADQLRSVSYYSLRSEKYEDISDDELNGTDRHWTEGLIGDLINECATLVHSAEVRWRQRSPLEDIGKSSYEEFQRGANMRPHGFDEIQDPPQGSEDPEMDEERMSRRLEHIARRQAEALLQTLHWLTKRDEEPRAMRREFPHDLGQTSHNPSPEPDHQDDTFAAGSFGWSLGTKI